MKKLFISIFTCVFALFALGTSTFAWFSMNETVTAQDMAVTIKSDQTYLLIAAGNKTASEIQLDKAISADALNKSKTLLPAAHGEVTKISEVETASNWYYMVSDDPESSVGYGEQVPLSSLSDYVLINEFSLTVASGANPINNIRVNTCTISTTAPDGETADLAVKVIVATSEAAEEFSGSGSTRTGSGTGTVLSSSNLTDSDSLLVKVYIFWDGEDADVYTNGRFDLRNTTVTLTFKGEPVNA